MYRRWRARRKERYACIAAKETINNEGSRKKAFPARYIFLKSPKTSVMGTTGR